MRTTRALVAGFGLQIVGAIWDGVYHQQHPHVASSPGYVHAPAYLGIVVILAGLLANWIQTRPRQRWIALGAVLVQLAGISWSLSVDAEARRFYPPAIVVALGGVVSFVVLALPRLRRRMALLTQRTTSDTDRPAAKN